MSGPTLILAELWDSFSKHVLPANCSAVQRIETRRAFYAGAHGMLNTLGELPEDEEAVKAFLANVKVEVDAYVADLKAGRA